MIVLSKEQILQLHIDRQKELSDIILALASGEIGAEKILQWIIEHQK